MMSNIRPARINVRYLVILTVGLGILCAGVLFGHRFRKKLMADTALAEGHAAQQRSDYVEASRQFSKYLSNNPDDLEILTRYAEANLRVRPMQAEKISAAIAAFRRVFRQAPADAKAWRELVKLYSAVGQHHEAAYVCRRRLESAPDDPTAQLWLAKSLVAQRDSDAASEVLRKLTQSSLDDQDAQRVRVQAFGLLAGLTVQNHSEDARAQAAAILDQAVEYFPASAEARLQRARFRRNFANDATAASEDLLAAESLFGDDPTVGLGVADEWLALDEPHKAAASLSRLGTVAEETLARFDIDPEAWAYVSGTTAGKLALKRGNSETGSAAAEESLRKLSGPRRLAFIPMAVDLYLSAGRLDDSRALADEFRLSIHERADTPDQLRRQSALLTAMVAGAQEQHLEVIRVLDETFTIQSPPARAQKILWKALDATGQTRRARKVLQDYVRTSPSDGEALLAFATSLRGVDWRQAQQWGARALKENPENFAAAVLVLEARTKLAAGSPQPSAELIAVEQDVIALIAIHPRATQLRLLQAGIEFRRQRPDEALATLEKALIECDPDSEVDVALVNLLTKMDRPQEAIARARQSILRHPSVAQPRLRLAELLETEGDTVASLQILTDAARGLHGNERVAAAAELARSSRDANARVLAAEVFRGWKADAPLDVRPCLALLALPAIQEDAAASQFLINDLKKLEGEPRGTHWRHEQARLWLRGDFSKNRELEIEQLLTECVRNDPVWSAPVVVLGRMYEKLDRRDQAEITYRRYIDANSLPGEVPSQLVLLLERQKRFDEAEQVLRRFPVGSPRLKEHRLSLALGRGDLDTAIDDLRQRIADEPRDADLRILLARLILKRDGGTKQVLELLDQAESNDRTAPGLPATRVAALRAMGRVDEALKLLDARIQQNKDADSRILRAGFLASIQRFDDAEADLKAACELEPGTTAAHDALGRFYQDQGRWPDSSRAFEAALRSKPNDLRLRGRLAQALLHAPDSGEVERGKALIENLISEQPNNAEWLVLAAEFSLREANDKAAAKAILFLDRAVSAEPKFAKAHLLRIETAAALEGLAAVDDSLIRALASCPDNPDLLFLRAAFEADRGNDKLADEMARLLSEEDSERLRMEPADRLTRNRLVRTRVLLADVALRGKNFPESERHLAEAFRTDPDNDFAHLARARWLDATGHREEAISELETFRRSKPGGRSVPILIALAEFYRAKADFAAAGECLGDARNHAPDSPALLVARMELAAAQRRFDDIVALADGTDSKVANAPNIRKAAAFLLAASGEKNFIARAERIFTALVEQRNHRADEHLGLAQTRHSLGDLPGSIEAYRRVLTLEPYHPRALNNLAWILAVENGNAEEALALAEKGVRRFPEDVYLLDTRGVILHTLNRPADAKPDFERCLGLGGQSSFTRAQVLLHLGRSLLQLDQRDDARTRLEEARRIDEQHKVLSPLDRADLGALLTKLASAPP